MTSAELHAQTLNVHLACGHGSAYAAHTWDIAHDQTLLLSHTCKTCSHHCATCTQLHLQAWGKVKRGQWALNTCQVDYIGSVPPSRGWQYVYTSVDM